MSHMLAFHIGPVQDFIVTARRTQDWWMGSWFLSHLSQTAIKAVPNYEHCLVLPKELPQSDDPNVADTPNHFLALIADENPTGVAHAIETAVKDRWRSIHLKVKNEFFRDVPDELWTRQLQSLLEIYWAIVPDDNLKTGRRRAQAALEARKRLRGFSQTEEMYLKCTLCGVRQELSGKESREAARRWWERRRERLRLRENERLCGVCVVKRAALSADALPLKFRDGHFPSTSSVAAATFKRRLLEEGKATDELERHFRVLRSLGIPAKVDERCLPGLAVCTEVLPKNLRDSLLTLDGDLFYVETFTEKRLNEDFPGSTAAILRQGAEDIGFTEDELLQLDPGYVTGKIENAAQSLRALFRAVRDEDPSKHVSPPSKYFAALMMDGDHMGRFFDRATDQEAQELSRQMSQLACSQAREVVTRHFGRLVYAGGDDALALLPLEEALPCARELQQRFKQAVKEVPLPEGVDTRPTPSVGIAIAHHTQPFDGILIAMQQAEKSAKRDYGRDALCVHVLKRSGEQVRVGTHWNYQRLDVIDLVGRLVTCFRDGTLTMKFGYAVAAEARGLAGDIIALPPEARAAAFRRLAKRHCGKGKQSTAEAVAAELAWWAESKDAGDQKLVGIQEVAQWILLARFIASGGKDD
jgi:CRISPR-associated protein Cmr2